MRIVIIHFSPLELYPPVQNLLRIIKDSPGEFQIKVISTANLAKGLSPFELDDDRISFIRYSHTSRRSSWRRFLAYMRFYLSSIIHLVTFRPRKILYFETLSSFPAYVYRRFIDSQVKVFVHYHEYTSQGEYANGMKLVQFFNRLEKWLYPKSSWVSHTNEFRMQKFSEDIHPVQIPCRQLLPNYPPKAWSLSVKRNLTLPLKVVYIGALSLETMYVKEFAEWVLSQNGKVVWTIFSHNCTDDARNYIRGVDPMRIVLNEGVNYEILPSILVAYHVGVILYKGHIPNYVYNAPNKLFEYLTCGLSVVFPEVMVGSLQFVDSKRYPRVISANFEQLGSLQPEFFIDSETLEEREEHYHAETALEPLLSKLLHQ